MTSIYFSLVLIFAPARDNGLQTFLLTLLPVVIGITIAVVLILYRRKQARARTQIMQAAAAQLGWTFSAAAPWHYLPGLDRFTLFNQGHNKEMRNMMYGQASG